MKKLLITLALAAATGTVLAQATPVGLWKTIDDETKTEKSLVRITEAGGVLSGRVEKFLDPKTKADGDRQHWEGGEILDPNNGKVYKLRLKPVDGGKALEVRGYIGPFFRNQQWQRVE